VAIPAPADRQRAQCAADCHCGECKKGEIMDSNNPIELSVGLQISLTAEHVEQLKTLRPKAKKHIDVRVDYNDQIVEMTFQEFFTRLGFIL
jgi:hypothetical protein